VTLRNALRYSSHANRTLSFPKRLHFFSRAAAADQYQPQWDTTRPAPDILRHNRNFGARN
jgi:hypothetical protein